MYFLTCYLVQDIGGGSQVQTSKS